VDSLITISSKVQTQSVTTHLRHASFYGFAFVGDACTVDNDCVGYLEDKVVRCINGFCFGSNSGEKCNKTNECNWGLYCAKNSTCLTVVPAGGVCDYDLVGPCEFGYVCSEEKNCISFRSKVLGDACHYYNSSSTQDNSECYYNLYCNPQGKCDNTPPIIPCMNDTDCTSIDGSCSCDFFYPDQTGPICQSDRTDTVPLICKPTYDAIIPCTISHQCTNPVSQESFSCSQMHCQQESDCLMACLVQNQAEYQPYFNIGYIPKPDIVCQTSSNSTSSADAPVTTKAISLTFALFLFVGTILL